MSLPSRLRLIALSLAMSAMTAGCGSAARSEPEPLLIAAASDLQLVLPRILEAYRTEAGASASSVFGASGTLSAQIEQGAPFDLFLSADRGYVSALSERGAIRADSVRDYAVGELVMVVGESLPEIVQAEDLKTARFRVMAIANPSHAPYGRAAREFLERSGIWDAVSNRVVLAANVREAARFVESGDAEVGFVSGSSARAASGVRVVAIDASKHTPLIQSLGIPTRSTRVEEAERFARFLVGPIAQALLAREGFAPAAAVVASENP
ncbi:MAG: molybdate ABC transporter substrate-binding protein [Isosphaeraceae bacterium]|nr:molybdate ABC transporter substrate-binding protein [Isosphaeraceae bacterium]